MGLKEPGLRGSLRNTGSVVPAFFDVTITNTNSPVQEGDILTVDYSADNTGDAQDMQDIRLEIDSVQEDVDPNVMLAGGASTTGTLEWDTTGEAEAEYTATVLSDDDSDSVTVEIGSAIPDRGIFLDDFADNKTQNRDDFETVEYAQEQTEGITGSAFDDPVRPEWDSDESVIDGILQPGHSISVSIPVSASEFWSNDWYTRWIVSAASSGDRGDWQVVREDVDNRWQHRFSNGEYDFVKRVNGDFTTVLGPVTIADDTEFQTIEVFYTESDSSWELVINGTSEDTATDSFQPDPNSTELDDNSGDGGVKVDDVTIA